MEKINFEESMKELEKIVQELEKGDLSLEDSMKKFEQGIELSKKCNKYLEEAEKKITTLVNTEKGIVEENL